MRHKKTTLPGTLPLDIFDEEILESMLDNLSSVRYNAPMKANEKHPALDALFTSLMGKDRAEVIRLGKCMTCDSVGNTHTSFRDDLSRKEYQISGMCQRCQDDIFGVDEED